MFMSQFELFSLQIGNSKIVSFASQALRTEEICIIEIYIIVENMLYIWVWQVLLDLSQHIVFCQCE